MPARHKTAAEKAASEKLKREIGCRIVLLREVYGLTQAEFARRADMASNHLSQIENGKKLPSIEAAVKISDAHNVPLDWIFKGDIGSMSVKLNQRIRDFQNARHD